LSVDRPTLVAQLVTKILLLASNADARIEEGECDG
jgi:hypothetical protein